MGDVLLCVEVLVDKDCLIEEGCVFFKMIVWDEFFEFLDNGIVKVKFINFDGEEFIVDVIVSDEEVGVYLVEVFLCLEGVYWVDIEVVDVDGFLIDLWIVGWIVIFDYYEFG